MTSPHRGRIPAGVRAVFFDAVGTLIDPQPSAGTAYAEIGRRFGSQLDAKEVRSRFATVFQAEEDHDARHDHRTDEARELQRWQRIVRNVLDDVGDIEGCFQALYDHFAQPTAWRCKPGTAELLRALREVGYVVGLATNFDHRLRSVAAGLPELSSVEHLVISSEVGFKKPGRGFFDRLCERVRLSPTEVLLVGDDLDNDHAGAIAAGLHSLLYDPAGKHPVPAGQRLEALGELLQGIRSQ